MPIDNQRRESASPPSEVTVGAHVEVELVSDTGDRELLAFDVVPDGDADFAAGFLGVSTPLAQALLWRRAGEVVSYGVGDIREVRILAVAASRRAPDEAAAGRQAVIQKAVSKSDLADAVRFSLTVDLKWGDTDPQGIADNWEE